MNFGVQTQKTHVKTTIPRIVIIWNRNF